MCGIVGMVAKRRSGFFSPMDKVFNNLLYIDALRGEDAAGVFSVDRDGDVAVLKEEGHVVNFLVAKEYKKFQDNITKDAIIAIGHNRKATQGAINDANAHPFVVKNEFVLVHNGTLSYHTNLNETAEVDSEVLAKYLHRETPKEEDLLDSDAWSKVFDKVYGAYALIWYDQRYHKLFVIRNSQRPLVIAETADAFVFASEGSFIAAAANRHSVKVEKYLTVPEKKLLVFDLKQTEVLLNYKEVAVVALPFQQTESTVSTTTTTCGTVKSIPAQAGKRIKGLTSKWVGKVIKVRVEDIVEMGVKTSDYFFYGDTEDLPFKGEVVGRLDEIEHGMKILELCHTLYTENKDAFLTCKIKSIEKAIATTNLQINVEYDETTITH